MMKSQLKFAVNKKAENSAADDTDDCNSKAGHPLPKNASRCCLFDILRVYQNVYLFADIFIPRYSILKKANGMFSPIKNEPDRYVIVGMRAAPYFIIAHFRLSDNCAAPLNISEIGPVFPDIDVMDYPINSQDRKK